MSVTVYKNALFPNEKTTTNFVVEGRDFGKEVFFRGEFRFIGDAVKMFRTLNAWYLDLIDGTTGEVLCSKERNQILWNELEI